jgi:hypothetical protein
MIALFVKPSSVVVWVLHLTAATDQVYQTSLFVNFILNTNDGQVESIG